MDTNTGRWTATINSTDICTLYYHIYIDCSVIPTSNNTSTLTLSQVWTDSLSHIYSFGGNADTSASIVVFKPHIVNIGTSGFFANYLDTIQMTFMYKNTNSGTANILVRFFHDSSHYCASLPPIALNFRVGINGFPIAYTSGTEIPITLLSNDTLIFEELAIDSLCIYCDTICTNNTCTRNVNFNWRCNVPLP
ncbi:MAG: hypothetical protein IPM91_08255 [Bacteroidetes bacterium]|nr:hypothetical protein [Bacteroidota bacterium]